MEQNVKTNIEEDFDELHFYMKGWGGSSRKGCNSVRKDLGSEGNLLLPIDFQ